MIAKVTIVGNSLESIILPIPEAIADAVGYKEGDELTIEIPSYRYGKIDYLVLHKKGA